MRAGDRSVTAEIRIDAQPDAVFPFLTEPDEIVRLTHPGFPDGADVGQLEGWQHFLPRLAAVAAGDPRPDPRAEPGRMG